MSLDQSFSAGNFRKIFDIENRKGVFLEGRFFPDTERVIALIQKYNSELRQKRRHRNIYAARIKALKKGVKHLKKIKEEMLMSILQKVSDQVTGRSYEIKIKQHLMPGAKSIYTVVNSPSNYFAIKQLQKNMSRLFHVKQSNRFAIVSQVTTLLEDKFPKFVIRTDINDFYESISHEYLSDIIHENNLLSPLSKKLIRQILNQYKVITGNDKGIPRGIGVSAYLAERYMRDIDEKILALKGVTYYARYVDDIIIIFTPESTEANRNYRTEVEKIIEDKALSLNPTKTEEIDLTTSNVPQELEYLGYKICFGDGNLKTSLTAKKKNKYKERIDQAISEYNNLSKVDAKGARKVFVKRIRFLTGNTRLANNKKNILVGIYYSNSHLTELNDLSGLDKYLRHKIETEISSFSLKNRLKKYRFKEGFETKRFSPFTPHDLTEIMKIWPSRA